MVQDAKKVHGFLGLDVGFDGTEIFNAALALLHKDFHMTETAAGDLVRFDIPFSCTLSAKSYYLHLISSPPLKLADFLVQSSDKPFHRLAS
ncbi:hypothetical protein RRG08_020261 [Elysia crispata]|uniref:Uncharacterized protein n=1 Tax=Elysia crispata TaxID=231223 RepID=A0AAE0YY08_9GAST|nr:hypothetical protein RRG08_020261 [Elysia crispata]